MAEIVISLALERLGELLVSEAKLLYGVRNQINEIQREMERMQCFLKEADKKQNQDERVRKWVAEIRELAFKTEDVIETFALGVAAKNQKSGFKDIFRRFACIFSQQVSHRDIDAIKAELVNITASLQTYGITKGLQEGATSYSGADFKSWRMFYSHDIEKDFVGMDKEMQQLISHLKKEIQGCEVVSICGMGGQGKTTLAKILYNHVEVQAHFEAFAWVCITQQFDREKVLKGILKELVSADREEEVSRMDDAKLVRELYQVQQEKNCLIVIDDIWTVDSWRSLKPAFPVGLRTSGSKILLTTRDVKVAEIGSVYKIHGLSEEEGWQLFSNKAGVNDIHESRVTSEMERIGRNMVKRCKGLPLAISSLGGILKGKLLREWEIINKDISFYLAKGGVSNDDEYYTVTQILGLSYDSLPPRLRQCFLCFANYKEDEIIKAEELYMFWIAEGLISVENKAEGAMMLDVAERYLDELAHRSLVQVETSKVEDASWSRFRTCRVHDLIRDLCLSKVKDEKVISIIHLHCKPEDESRASIVRRLCIHSYDNKDESMLKLYDQHVISHIRSLHISKDLSNTQGMWPENILSLEKFKLLRVMSVSRYEFTKKNIKRIDELVYLKYLGLGYCLLEELPSSLGNLRNLETLDLRVSDGIAVPNVLWKLKQLKHLYLPGKLEGSKVEKLRFEGLNELELLYNFDSMYCDAHDLIRLCKLKIFGGNIIAEENLTENVIDFIKFRELRHSNLEIRGGELCCLVLLFECSFIDKLTISTRICMFPTEYDHARFSGRLTVLWLENCRIDKDLILLLEKLPNLRRLSLGEDAYLGAEMVCSATGFPQLEYLYLFGLHGLRMWRLDEGAMPNLSYLRIYKCEKLAILPQGLRYLAALEFLYIVNMPNTFINRIKVIDGVEGEDFYKVRRIPNVFVLHPYETMGKE